MAKLGDLFPEEMQPQAPKAAARPKAAVSGKSAAPSAAGAPALRASGRVFVQELASGQDVDGVFLVAEATLRAAKNGSKYVQATLGDKTGTVPVRQWDATDKDFACYKVSGYTRVRGRVETYKNTMQMIVFSVQECGADEVDAQDFLPVSARPLDEMTREFDALLQSISDPDYKNLLETIFGDPAVRARFLKSPAATAVHHAWVGGLLEHVLSAARTAQSIAEQRPYLNRDLLMTGVILHDIGKIEELDPGPGFTYTDTGRLCGHISLGVLMIERNLLKIPGFPRKKRDLILHMVLSHHGELEYGSPVKPVTAEAMALHHVECLDAKVQGIQTLIERDRTAGNDGAWTDFARVVDGRIYKG